MRQPRPGIRWLIFLLALSALAAPLVARGDLQWQQVKKESIRVRLVALTWNHPRSSFFASEEIFIAEKELDKNEGSLMKLVYGFLPYQPRLSEAGLDYATVHEIRVVRDPDCDETVAQMTTGQLGDWRQVDSGLKYSTDAPKIDFSRRHSPLPCYVTTADDYTKPVHDPVANPSGEDTAAPKLATRPPK